jgi:hypothetical protein
MSLALLSLPRPQWKFARWAEALTIAAEFENSEGGSR